MKKIIIALAASIVVSTSAMAGEEIKLAAAIGSGAAVRPAPSDDNTGGAAVPAGTAGASAGMTTTNMVAVGVLAAAGLAAVANSGSSTSH